jgi:hypothetical protein
MALSNEKYGSHVWNLRLTSPKISPNELLESCQAVFLTKCVLIEDRAKLQNKDIQVMH